MKLIGTNFDSFKSLPGVNTLPQQQARALFDRIQDIQSEIPWLQFTMLPFIEDLSLTQQTSIYRQYLLDRMDALRQIAQIDADRAKVTYDNGVNTFNNLNWLRNNMPGDGSSYRETFDPPHILLEDGDDILLEDRGLILLEADSA